ncbi:MAG: hypothetical protein AAF089_17940 [Bacteroidota bacterium]
MELLPILSTIILVGTLATLILAVAAYVLYKVRERQGRGAPAPPPDVPPQPLLLTAPAGTAQGDTTQVAQLQELLRLAAAGLQQQAASNALPPAAPEASPDQAPAPEGWSAPAPPGAPAAPLPEPAWEDATFEDVTPLRAGDLADFFGEEHPEPTSTPVPLPASSPVAPPKTSSARRPTAAPREAEPVLREQPTVPAAPRPTLPQAAPPRPAPKPSAPAPSTAASASQGPPSAVEHADSAERADSKDEDYQELLRLADELDTLLDLDPPHSPAPHSPPPPRDERLSWE